MSTTVTIYLHFILFYLLYCKYSKWNNWILNLYIVSTFCLASCATLFQEINLLDREHLYGWCFDFCGEKWWNELNLRPHAIKYSTHHLLKISAKISNVYVCLWVVRGRAWWVCLCVHMPGIFHLEFMYRIPLGISGWDKGGEKEREVSVMAWIEGTIRAFA